MGIERVTINAHGTNKKLRNMKRRTNRCFRIVVKFFYRPFFSFVVEAACAGFLFVWRFHIISVFQKNRLSEFTLTWRTARPQSRKKIKRGKKKKTDDTVS